MCVCACKPSSFIQNPKQAGFEFEDTRFPDQYRVGFHTGVHWDANWMPGGPWFYTGERKAQREADAAASRAWHEGFNQGLKLRLANDAHFAKWWDTNRQKGGHLRYTAPECVILAA